MRLSTVPPHRGTRCINNRQDMDYFNFKELTTTATGLPNMPLSMEIVRNLCELCDTLNVIRGDYGEPIIVNSAYRSAEVNKAVLGAVNSWHMLGKAADIRPEYVPSNTYYQRLQQLIDVVYLNRDLFKEVKIYTGYIHVAI